MRSCTQKCDWQPPSLGTRGPHATPTSICHSFPISPDMAQTLRPARRCLVYPSPSPRQWAGPRASPWVPSPRCSPQLPHTHCSFCGLNGEPPKTCPSPNAPEPVNGTIFGTDVLTDVSKSWISRWGHPGFRVSPKPRDSCPYRRKAEGERRHIDTRLPRLMPL